jgi:DNA-binding NtrC family response regulator
MAVVGSVRGERVAVIDDDVDVLSAARMVLKRRFATVLPSNSPAALLDAMDKEPEFDALLLDMNFRRGDDTGADGLAWIDRFLQRDPHLSIVCFTAYGDIDLAVESMRRGAVDFVIKPWENERLVATMRNAVELSRARREAGAGRERVRELTRAPGLPPTIVARSRAFQDALSLAHRVAPTDASVFILGENGVGKEVIAREIHRVSARSAEPFVAIDLGAIPEALAESELFGHRKGGFTDAKSDRAGRVAAAHGGTLFLDEIANASPGLQQKLLALLERREIIAVGDDRPRPIDVRVIAATNASREQLLAPHRFRADLLYRLNTVEIMVPPLRERREDIPAMIEQFGAEFARRYGKPTRQPDAAAMEALIRHDWPGNVRALRHAVERATILAQGNSFRPDDFALAPRHHAAASHADPSAPLPAQKPTQTLEQVERDAIAAALIRHSGNASQAAADLGITRQSLYRRMSKHGL